MTCYCIFSFHKIFHLLFLKRNLIFEYLSISHRSGFSAVLLDIFSAELILFEFSLVKNLYHMQATKHLILYTCRMVDVILIVHGWGISKLEHLRANSMKYIHTFLNKSVTYLYWNSYTLVSLWYLILLSHQDIGMS